MQDAGLPGSGKTDRQQPSIRERLRIGWGSADWLVAFTRILIPVCLALALLWQIGISLWPLVRPAAPAIVTAIITLALIAQIAQGAVWLWRQHPASGSAEERKAATRTALLESSGVVFSIMLLVLGLALLVSLFQHSPREWHL